MRLFYKQKDNITTSNNIIAYQKCILFIIHFIYIYFVGIIIFLYTRTLVESHKLDICLKCVVYTTSVINISFIKQVMLFQINPVRTNFNTAPRFNASVTYFRGVASSFTITKSTTKN